MFIPITILGEGDGTPLQYSCLENPMDRGAWWARVHGVARSWTWLSDLTFTFHFHALEKEMATHSSVLALRIPGTGEPGGLPSMGSHRVGHDWSDLAAAAAAAAVLSRKCWWGFCISLGTLLAFNLKGPAYLWEILIGGLEVTETWVSCIFSFLHSGYDISVKPSLREKASPG